MSNHRQWLSPMSATYENKAWFKSLEQKVIYDASANRSTTGYDLRFTLIYYSSSMISDVESKLNDDLAIIKDRFNSNLLTFNFEKS